jgi:ketosteroid isomerase-like protein
MTESEDNVALVRRMYDAFATRDLDAIVAIVDPAIQVTQTSLLPWGGEYHGLEGLAAFFGKLTETITSAVTPRAIYSAGDRVVQAGRTAGTVNASGASFDVDEVHILTVRDRRVVRFEAHIDTPAMLAALGAAEAS